MFYYLIVKLCTTNIIIIFEYTKKVNFFDIFLFVNFSKKICGIILGVLGGQLNLRPLIPRALGAPVFRELYFTHTREARARVFIFVHRNRQLQRANYRYRLRRLYIYNSIELTRRPGALANRCAPQPPFVSLGLNISSIYGQAKPRDAVLSFG